VKDRKITVADCRYLEMRMVIYAIMSQSVCSAWAEAIPDLKASFDTVMRMYQQLNNDCRYTHGAAILSFNVAADELGVPHVTMRVHEYDYEEDEEEDSPVPPTEAPPTEAPPTGVRVTDAPAAEAVIN
jgi:hypothetical protein